MPGGFHGDFGDLQQLQPAPHARQIVTERAVDFASRSAALPHGWQYANHNRVVVDIQATTAAVYYF